MSFMSRILIPEQFSCTLPSRPYALLPRGMLRPLNRSGCSIKKFVCNVQTRSFACGLHSVNGRSTHTAHSKHERTHRLFHDNSKKEAIAITAGVKTPPLRMYAHVIYAHQTPSKCRCSGSLSEERQRELALHKCSL